MCKSFICAHAMALAQKAEEINRAKKTYTANRKQKIVNTTLQLVYNQYVGILLCIYKTSTAVDSTRKQSHARTKCIWISIDPDNDNC